MNRTLRTDRSSRALALAAAVLGFAGAASAQQVVAYNDFDGLGTLPAYTTTYSTRSGGTTSGFLTNSLTNTATSYTVTVAHTTTGTAYGSQSGTPALGTDARNTFAGHVSFGNSSSPSSAINLNNADSTFTYTFSNLSTTGDVLYGFAGTFTRGLAGTTEYTNRWTLVTLLGAVSATVAHTADSNNVVTFEDNPFQVAVNTGGATVGVVARWLDIDAGLDGQFTILMQQYTGAIPSGGNAGGTGYGLSHIQFTAASIPEPASVAVFGGVLALGFVGASRRRLRIRN